MNSVGVRKRVWFLLFLFAQLGTAHAKPPSLESYGELPDVEDIAISPSGKRFAMLETNGDERAIVIKNEALEPIFVVGVQNSKVRSIEFITDDLVLMQRSETQKLDYRFLQDKAEFYQAFLVSIKAGTSELIFEDRSGLLNSVFGYYGIRDVDGKPTAFFGAIELARDSASPGGYVFKHGRPALYSVDLTTNKSRSVEGPPRNGTIRDWLVGKDGEVVARLDVSLTNGNWSIRGSASRIASGTAPTGSVSLVSIGKDGSTIIYGARAEGEEATTWFEVPIDGSSRPAEVFPGINIGRLFRGTRSGELIGYQEGVGVSPIVLFDSKKSDRVRKVSRTFGAYSNEITDWTPNFDHVLVRISGNGDTGSHFKVDLSAMRADAVAYERDAIKSTDVGPISIFAYSATDGLQLDGILTLPPKRDPKDLPVVILPHGGPHSHDIAHFDWWAQAFASRGYAVFQPNFRGSTNRDQAFVNAGYGQWGRKMSTDLSDGLAALAEAGIVDPVRACIVGASYGGYAALAGVTLQQGVYKCAVSVNGVSDLTLLTRIASRESGQSRIVSRSLEEQLGPRSTLREISPRFQAAKANAPILLIHGANDTVVPFEHSSKMADALKDEGKAVKIVELEGEDHWLSFAPTRLAMLQASIAFVQQHNPAD